MCNIGLAADRRLGGIAQRERLDAANRLAALPAHADDKVNYWTAFWSW